MPPPVGPNGEPALTQMASGCGGCEGNAQSLLLLPRIEAKIPGAGLNLTRATLDATLKYPWLASEAATDASADGAKFGCYDDDAEVFAWIREGAPARRACLEAQVMDWADDVAYSVHDLEDGLHSGLITLARMRDPDERRQVAELSIAQYLEPGSATVEELCEVFDRLLTLDCWPVRFDGEPQTVAAVKHLTSELIGRFCGAAERATLAAGSAPLTRYACDLDVPRERRLECALREGVTDHYVMGRHGAQESQARERAVLTDLVAALAAGAPGALDPLFRSAFDAAASDAARLRVVVDQVASLTDTSALAWHSRLCP